MQTARHLVAVVVELAAGVQHGHHDFGGRLAARVKVDRNAAAVVDDRDRAVDVNRDVDLIAEARQRLVDRVVHDLVDEVVQAGRTGRADVHRRPLADGLEPFENLDLVGGILGDVGRAAVTVATGHGVRRDRRRRRTIVRRRVCLLSGRDVPRFLSVPSEAGPVACTASSRSPLSWRSHPHRHDDVGVVVAFGADRPHDRLADFVLQVERDDIGGDRGEEIEHILRVEADLHRRTASSRPAASRALRPVPDCSR